MPGSADMPNGELGSGFGVYFLMGIKVLLTQMEDL